jgi:putative transposase
VGREGIELFGLKYSSSALAQEVDLGRKRVVRFDPRELAYVYLEQSNSEHLLVPLRDPSTPRISLWELKAIRKARSNTSDLDDPSILRRALEQLGEEGTAVSRLRSNRRSARRDAWRAVEQLAEVEVPTKALKSSLVSQDADSLPWEVLE